MAARILQREPAGVVAEFSVKLRRELAIGSGPRSEQALREDAERTSRVILDIFRRGDRRVREALVGVLSDAFGSEEAHNVALSVYLKAALRSVAKTGRDEATLEALGLPPVAESVRC